MSCWDPQRTAIEEPAHAAAPAPAGPLPAVAAPGPGSLDAGALIALQQTAGNAAVNGLMRRRSLQRCAGGACHCENCAGERHERDEREDADGVEDLELLLSPAQDVEGQEGGGLHTPDLEAMAAAVAELPDPAAAEPGAPAEGRREGEAPPPAQRALQRAIARAARRRMVSRAATWAVAAPKETNNLASAVINGTAAGVTWPTLNGSIFWSNAAARAAIKKPTVKTAAVAAGGFEAQVDTVLDNVGSFDETVLSAGPWTTAVARATIAARFPALAQCSTAGNTTFRAKGDPSDAEMQAANRRHEDKHAADHKAAFNATIVPWDKKLTDAKTAGTKFQGATAAEAEAKLWTAMGGTPDQVADAFMARCAAAVVAYHGSAAGGPIGAPTGPEASADCATSSAKYTNPS